MVSTIRYRSFKEFDWRERRPARLIFVLAVALVFVALYPTLILLLLAIAYALSGPAGWVWAKLIRGGHPTGEVAPPQVAGEERHEP
jgi:CDP-diacylglycerol--serine O-phosphatidyltransferase